MAALPIELSLFWDAGGAGGTHGYHKLLKMVNPSTKSTYMQKRVSTPIKWCALTREPTSISLIRTGKDAVDKSRQKAFFPLGRSSSAEQILSFVEQHGWDSICIRLSRHLGGQHLAKPITLRAQLAETIFEVDTNTNSQTDEADLMDVPIKDKQQLASNAKEHTARSVHWRMGELFRI